MPKKVLIFCDPGIDDTMALLLAFFIDEIEIIGIVADYGNVPKEMAYKMLIFLRTKQGIEILRYSVVQNALLLVPRLLFYRCTRETRTWANYSKWECD